MYKGFNLKIDNVAKFNSDNSYTNQLDEKKQKITLTIDNIMFNNGYIDSEKIIDNWFPSDDYHVFISHSHQDIDKAKALANWLYENFKIKSFIDSHVWGYANDLLYKLNHEYARLDADTFVYESAIIHAANVHLMLSTALNEAIDKAECLFFINTNNTIQNIKLDDGNHELRTASAWIMHELKTSALIRRTLSDKRPKVAVEKYNLSIEEAVTILHKVSTEHLIDISEEDIMEWRDICNPIYKPQKMWLERRHEHIEYDALDKLYYSNDINKKNSLLEDILNDK